MSEYEFHELSEVFPLMGKDEVYELAKDISKNGLLEPIVLLDGKILDGRNRYTACRMINCPVETVEFDDTLDPQSFVVAMNLHRRHLTSAQKCELGIMLLPIEREKSKERMSLGGQKGSTSKGIPSVSEGSSRDSVAKQLCISKNTLDKWQVISDKAKDSEIIASLKNDILNKCGKETIESLFKIVQKKKKVAAEAIKVKELLAEDIPLNKQVVCDSLENVALKKRIRE